MLSTCKELIIFGAFLFSPLAQADFLNCDLTLNLIEGTYSSDAKQLYFEAEVGQSSSRLLGSLNTVSCFGTNFQQFKSETAKITADGLFDKKVRIGNYFYRFDMKFTPAQADFFTNNEDVLVVSGKIIPLSDQDSFFHQVVAGTCKRSDVQVGLLGLLDRTNHFIINYENNKRRDVCR